MSSFTTKLTRNVLHQYTGTSNQAVILMHGLGGCFGQTQQLASLLHQKLSDYKVINLSLPLHNDAPSLHGNNHDIEWKCIDIEYMLSVVCEEHKIENSILIGSAFTGYPMISFRLNNPSLVNYKIISTDWMIKAPDTLITDPNIAFDNDLKFEQFKNDFVNSIENIFDLIGIRKFVHRHNLLNILQQFDIYDNNYTLKDEKTKLHITKGTYNKEKQIKILLGDVNRCKRLKTFTKELDYQWNYSAYC
eukprot:488310_1